MLLGAFTGAARREVRVRLQPGDALIIASDGVLEPLDAADRLAGVVHPMWGRPAQQIADALMDAPFSDRVAVASHPDDRSVLVLAAPDGDSVGSDDV